MIEKLNIQDFDIIYDLMEISFPNNEYRTYDEQKELLNNLEYSIYVLRNEPKVIKAFISVWKFNEFSFIEHFAVNPEYRNAGIGAYVLNKTAELLDGIVCLEVEPPETKIATRRIEFYKRNNFFINEYPYMQPPISKGKNAIPLFIMTSGSKVNEYVFQKIKATLYHKVYN